MCVDVKERPVSGGYGLFNSLKAVFHFNRTVLKRGVFPCLVSFQAELMTLGQKKTLRFGTVRYGWSGKRALHNPTDFVTSS